MAKSADKSAEGKINSGYCWKPGLLFEKGNSTWETPKRKEQRD